MELENLNNNQIAEKPQDNPAFNFFLYLLSFLTMGFLAWGIGGILFQTINKFFSEQKIGYSSYFNQGIIKYSIASIIIAGVIYLLLQWFITKYIFEGRISLHSSVRKWLTYIIMFFAAGTIIGDLVALIFNFLNGDIAIRVILKILVILFIAAAIFVYYFWDIRKKEGQGKKYSIHGWLFWLLIIFCLVLVIGGFFLIDSPKISREKTIDKQTVIDLDQIASAVQQYYLNNEKLPEQLVQMPNTYYLPQTSSESNIQYQKITETSFRLCANFMRSNLDDLTEDMSYYYGSIDRWRHNMGRVCFDQPAEGLGAEKTIPAPIY